MRTPVHFELQIKYSIHYAYNKHNIETQRIDWLEAELWDHTYIEYLLLRCYCT